MAFKNEHVPRRTDADSICLARARQLVQLGPTLFAMWTVDRDADMALVRIGAGYAADAVHREVWRFVDPRGVYGFVTEVTAARRDSFDLILMTRRIRFEVVPGMTQRPCETSFACIHAALEAYKDYGAISSFKRCRLRLEVVEPGAAGGGISPSPSGRGPG